MNVQLPIWFICSLAVLFLPTVHAQEQVDYSDVGLIINTNSSVSQEIGEYFSSQRNIPESHIFRIDIPQSEEITENQFQDYLSKVKSVISSRNLNDSLNYLVTTKGCPLKVLRFLNDSNFCNASVESEFMLIPEPNNARIGSCITYANLNAGNFFKNPYYAKNGRFSKSQYGIFLVTRLDGYSIETVKSLIDRSGPNTFVDKDSALFVFDQATNFAGFYQNQEFITTGTRLTNTGWNALVNTDSVFVTDQKNVMGYASWGSNDLFADSFTVHAQPRNTWLNGSIAETHVSTSGRSFEPGTGYGQSLIADLLEEGVTGVKGYVYEPLTIALAISSTLFPKYTEQSFNGVPRYNLAESFFNASQMIGWMDVVIGDPKTSITSNPGLANGIRNPEMRTMTVFPNPAAGSVNVHFSSQNSGIVSLEIYDVFGRVVRKIVLPKSSEINETILLDGIQNGIYFITLKSVYIQQNAKMIVAKP
jgi:uncharacterized protein (TIGR03790 family)